MAQTRDNGAAGRGALVGVLAAASVALVAPTAGAAAVASAPGAPCAAVHVLAARGSNQDPGPGSLSSLVSRIQSSVTQSVSTSAVDYPAKLEPYKESAQAGDAAVKQELTDLVRACPNQKIVLAGYSQGAQIIGDALAGGGDDGILGSKSAPVDRSIAGHVVAVIQYADPRHAPNLPFDSGTANDESGLFPRDDSQSLAAFANITRSYCDMGDPVCAGGMHLSVHSQYPGKHDDEAAAFVLDRLHRSGIA